METIQRYIEFAIENEYTDWISDKFDVENNTIQWYEYPVWVVSETNLIETITSKEFIEAVARGIENKSEKEGCLINTKIRWIGCVDDSYEIVEKITHMQAIAIRDNKLEEFINNLLTNK